MVTSGCTHLCLPRFAPLVHARSHRLSITCSWSSLAPAWTTSLPAAWSLPDALTADKRLPGNCHQLCSQHPRQRWDSGLFLGRHFLCRHQRCTGDHACGPARLAAVHQRCARDSLSCHRVLVSLPMQQQYALNDWVAALQHFCNSHSMSFARQAFLNYWPDSGLPAYVVILMHAMLQQHDCQ